MKKYRLFISIPLETVVVKYLERSTNDVFKILPADSFSLINRDLWHITLVFLGDQEEEDLALISGGIDELVSEFEPIDGRLVSIDYDKNKRMIWAYGDDDLSQALGEVSGRLQDILIDRGVQFKPENRRFKSHVTLGRANRAGNRALPEITKGTDLDIWIDRAELMSSTLTSSGPEYDKLGGFYFGNKLLQVDEV